MALRDEFEREGEWLFRWRSYLPLVLLTIVLGALQSFHYPYQSHVLDQAWELVCLGIAFFGLGIRALTVGFVPPRTSGRNTGGQVADVLNTTGMYSLMRHPLYFGNFWMWLGVSMFLRVWWCGLIVMLAFFLFYERVILAEESFLRRKFGAGFEAWASRTPAFWPRFRLWQRPALPFSMRTVLKRENSSFFAVIALCTLLESAGTIAAEGSFSLDPLWAGIFLGGLAVYATLKALKKLKVLSAPGR